LAGPVSFVRERLAKAKDPRKTRERNDKLGEGETNAAIFASARALAKKDKAE